MWYFQNIIEHYKSLHQNNIILHMGHSQDFHKGGAQLVGSPWQSRAWPALLAIGGGCRMGMFPLPPKAGSFWHFS